MKYTFSIFYCKYMWIVLILFVCNLPEYFSQNDGKESLKLVQIIMRHGDRYPSSTTYPTDPYKDESNWPGGYSQLTDKGKLRMYNLGKYLRGHYNKDIIGQSYTPKDVYMLSSDYDRNIRSAMALLAGLYKENNLNSTWNPDIKWDPIPVHTVAKEHDRIFEVTESCPKLDEIFNFVYNESDHAKLYREENKETLNYISENAGFGNFSGNIYSTGFIGLTLKFQKEQGLEIPSWAETLIKLDLPMTFHHVFNARLDWLRIRVGPLLSDLITNMEEAVSGAKTTVPMRFWMSHDIALSAMIATLDLYEQSVLPDYGSSIIFELHERNGQNSSLEHIIEVYIKNETSANAPVFFPIPECPSPCTIEKFKMFTHKFIPEDWNKECQEKMELNSPLKLGLSSSSSTVQVISTTVLLFICVCVIPAILVNLRKRNRAASFYEKL